MAQGKDWEKIANGLKFRLGKLTQSNRKLKKTLRNSIFQFDIIFERDRALWGQTGQQVVELSRKPETANCIRCTAPDWGILYVDWRKFV